MNSTTLAGWQQLERVMRLVPPGEITEQELVGLFASDRFEMLCTGAGRIDTVNVWPDGEPIRVPAIYLLARTPRQSQTPSDGAAYPADQEGSDRL